jgi:hypothetical protein
MAKRVYSLLAYRRPLRARPAARFFFFLSLLVAVFADPVAVRDRLERWVQAIDVVPAVTLVTQYHLVIIGPTTAQLALNMIPCEIAIRNSIPVTEYMPAYMTVCGRLCALFVAFSICEALIALSCAACILCAAVFFHNPVACLVSSP